MTADIELDPAKDGKLKSITVYSGGKAEITRTFALDLNVSAISHAISPLNNAVNAPAGGGQRSKNPGIVQ